MTEACAAVTDFWFETLGFPVLRVTKAVANAASRRISEKQKMRLGAISGSDYSNPNSHVQIWGSSSLTPKRETGGQAPIIRERKGGGRSGRAGSSRL
jgi:hypothetical protein